MRTDPEGRRGSGGRASCQTHERHGVSRNREDTEELLARLYQEAAYLCGPDDVGPRAYVEIILVTGRILDGRNDHHIRQQIEDRLSDHTLSQLDDAEGRLTGLPTNEATLEIKTAYVRNRHGEIVGQNPTTFHLEPYAQNVYNAYAQHTQPGTEPQSAAAVQALVKHGSTEEMEDVWKEGNQPEPNHKSGGALGYGQCSGKDTGKPTSEASDGDSEGDNSMWKSHDGGSLREKVPVPKLVSDELEAMLDEIEVGEYRSVLRRLIAHVYYCQTRMPNRYDEGVPVSYELLKQACRDANVEVPTRTKDIWEPGEDAVLDVSEYIFRDDDVGKSREYLLVHSALRCLDDALEDSYQYKTRYNLVDGKRLYSAFQTELTYDGEHSWKERSAFIYRVLKRLKGQRDLVNREAVEDHLDDLKTERDAARARYDRVQDHVEELEDQILEEGKTLSDGEKERLKEIRQAAFEAGRELDRIDARCRQDHRLWSDIIAQGLEEAKNQPEGIYEYETAYEVQEASGRLTCRCGLQNASEEMKAAAATSIPEYTNYDISSSQTEALIEEMEMAVRMGADLDVSVIKDYTENDGKDGLSDKYRIYRDRWKRPEHSVKFGAGFNHDSFEAARAAAEGRVLAGIEDEDGEPDFSRLHQFKNESGKAAYERAVYNELPTMAAVARDWADDEDIQYDDPETVYAILQDAYGEMAEELDAWRDWLVDEYWVEAGQSGSRFGYFVSNPCSIPFSIYDARLAESGDQPDRYNQKAGFATSRLQGREAAYIHALTLIQDDFDYEVLRNEHDGLVVVGTIPDEAREMARRISGFHRANLEEKPFEGHDDASDSNDVEDEPCDTTTLSPPFGQSKEVRPSKSPTSPSGGKPGDGSAGGMAARGGVRSTKTRSGSPQGQRRRSGTTSDTT